MGRLRLPAQSSFYCTVWGATRLTLYGSAGSSGGNSSRGRENRHLGFSFDISTYTTKEVTGTEAGLCLFRRIDFRVRKTPFDSIEVNDLSGVRFVSIKPKLTRPKSSNKIPKRYLESELSSQQIADEFGVSKQFVLTQLRAAGIRKTPRRGRSSENYRFHNPPYGFRARNGRLERDLREMKVARLIVELRDRGEKSFSEIAAELNRRAWLN